MSKVALVTGANKGIGYEIAKGLCKRMKGHVLLGARNMELGAAAVSKIKAEGLLNVELILLDISSKESIEKAKRNILNNFGGLDVLVNNAGTAYKVNSTVPFSEQAENTVGVNYFGTLAVCEAMFPLLRPGARVVNMASFNGKLAQVSKDWQDKFSSKNLSVPDLNEIMNKFIELTKQGNHKEHGFSNTAYGMGEVGRIALTRILAREILQDPRDDIIVCTMCPGRVKTDMSSQKGDRTPEEGADTAIFLALLPEGYKEAHGQYFRDRKRRNWLDFSEMD